MVLVIGVLLLTSCRPYLVTPSNTASIISPSPTLLPTGEILSPVPSAPAAISPSSTPEFTLARTRRFTHTPPVTFTPKPTRTSSKTRTPTLTATSVPFAIRNVPLSENGPWLVYQNTNDFTLIAVNADGSGRTVLPISGWDLAGSPHNQFLAGRYVADFDDLSTYTLFILHLPDLTIIDIQLATFPTIPDDNNYRQILQETISTSPAWSPDGRYLAFTGAIDGPSSDVYVYDTQTDQIRRLTDGANQASNLQWSPDGKWIVHHETKKYMGAGCQEAAVWAAALDGSGAKLLFSPSECTNIVGWTGPDTFISSEQTNFHYGCLRKVNISKNDMSVLQPGLFEDAVYFDPHTKYTFFKPFELGSPDNGIYSIGPSDSEPHLFAEDGVQVGYAHWIPGMEMLVTIWGYKECNITAYTQDGERACFDAYGTPSLSPDAQWFSGGLKNLVLYSSSGEYIREIAGDANFESWQPDSKGMVFITPDDVFPLLHSLFYVTIPGGNPQYVANIDSDLRMDFEIIWNPTSTGFFIYNYDFPKLQFYDSLNSQLTWVDENLGKYLINYAWISSP